MARTRWVTILGAAALAAAACSRPAPSAADAALREDLAAAQAHAAGAAGATARTQFVSSLELGRAADAAEPRTPRAAPARVAPMRAPARRPAPAAASVTRVSRPAPVAEAVDEVAAPERVAEAPSIDVEVAPLPEPARDEPIVAAPSRRPTEAPSRGRRGRVWTTEDVIRNAPFPVNP